jgi:hypothetical protein
LKELLYVIGQPGAGKTTLLNAALEGCTYETITKPFGMRRYPNQEVKPSGGGVGCYAGVQLGVERHPFSGTDTLSMSVQPLVLNWLAETSVQYVVGEGDRLSTEKFFLSVQELEWKLTVVWLSTPGYMARDRRMSRAQKTGIGTGQNECWVKGRITKVQKLAERYVKPEWCLDGGSSPKELGLQLRAHPVIAVIREVSL